MPAAMEAWTMLRIIGFAGLACCLSAGATRPSAADEAGAPAYTRANVALAELVWGASVDRYLPDGGIAFAPGGGRAATATLAQAEGGDCVFAYRRDGVDVLRLDLTHLEARSSRLHTGGRDVHRIFGRGIYCPASPGPAGCQDSLDLQDVSGSRRAEGRARAAFDFLLARCGRDRAR